MPVFFSCVFFLVTLCSARHRERERCRGGGWRTPLACTPHSTPLVPRYEAVTFRFHDCSVLLVRTGPDIPHALVARRSGSASAPRPTRKFPRGPGAPKRKSDFISVIIRVLAACLGSRTWLIHDTVSISLAHAQVTCHVAPRIPRAIYGDASGGNAHQQQPERPAHGPAEAAQAGAMHAADVALTQRRDAAMRACRRTSHLPTRAAVVRAHGTQNQWQR